MPAAPLRPVSVAFLFSVSRYLTDSDLERKDVSGLMAVSRRRPSQQGHEVGACAGHTTSRLSGPGSPEMGIGISPFSLLFVQHGILTSRWYHLHSEWVFPSSIKPV